MKRTKISFLLNFYFVFIYLEQTKNLEGKKKEEQKEWYKKTKTITFSSFE